MKQTINLIALGAIAAIGGLAFLNWATLSAPASINLIIADIQAPLGLVLLGLAGLLGALFFVAYLRNQIGSLLETRKLLKEIQRIQELADKAEASRIENLHQLISTEFRLLHERLDASAAQPSMTKDHSDGSPLSLTELITHGELA